MDLELQDARVLVTAASQGLGAATARCFSMEGARVAINSRNKEKLDGVAQDIRDETKGDVYSVAGSVAEAADEIVARAVAALGGLDVLVTNAGGPPAGKFDDFAADDWEGALRLTFLSATNLIRAALPHLRQSNRASILAIVSVAAKQPVDNLTLSNAIRPAVVGLTKTLSLELGSERIRVNSILPGITATERITHLTQARADRNQTSVEEEQRKTEAGIPLGRMGKPEEFANAAVFLCSPAAGFISGVALAVDGGATLATL